MASIKGDQAKAATAFTKQVWEKTALEYDEWAIASGAVKPFSHNTLAAASQALQGEGAVVLDVASASGEPAFTIAQALPYCQVICTDLSSTSVELAAKRAQQQGLSNVKCQQADAQDLSAFGDASVNAVTCQLGLMFVPDVDQAMQEFVRVLKPGGQMVATVWANQVTMLEIFGGAFAALSPTKPALPPTADPRRFADLTPLLASMRAAGLTDIQHAQHSADMSTTAAKFASFALRAGPLAAYITNLEGEDKAAKMAEADKVLRKLLAEKGQAQEDGTIVLCDNHYFTITAQKPAS